MGAQTARPTVWFANSYLYGVRMNPSPCACWRA